MNILVTGGAGFIGYNLCSFLLQMGHNVFSIDNLNSDYDFWIKEDSVHRLYKLSKDLGGVRYANVDLNIADPKTFDIIEVLPKWGEITHIIHLAAKAGVRESFDRSPEYFYNNVVGTANVIDAARKYGWKMIFASSSSVYGDHDISVQSSESDFLNPSSPYALTKKVGEELCLMQSQRHGMDIWCARFFTVYGRKQRPSMAISKFISAALHGDDIVIYGDGSAYRDFTHVSDIVDGLYKMIKTGISGFSVFNMGRGRPCRIDHVVDQILEHTRSKSKVVFVDKQIGDVNVTYSNSQFAKDMFGFKISTDILAGIRDQCNYMKGLK